MNVVLAVATGVLSALSAAHGHLAWQSALIAAYTAYTASNTTHNHLWKKLGVIDAVSAVAPTFGLGSPYLHGKQRHL